MADSIWQERFLAGVRPLVPYNLALFGEPPRAYGASVGLLTSVGLLVPRNVALALELHGAERATKRGGVDPLMLRQLAGTPEPLLAVPTEVYRHHS